MKKYNAIVNEDRIFVCELTADDVAKAAKEFSNYMQCKGETYSMDENKRPSANKFFKLYFGECEFDIYCGECWTTPNRYICTNKNVADKFMKLATYLNYHDRFNQSFCDVEQDGKIIDIYYGDY